MQGRQHAVREQLDPRPSTRAAGVMLRMNWLYFWAGALATYRLTVFVSRDRGPLDLFVNLRRSRVGKWAKCPFCVSPYAASAVACVLYLSGVSEPFGVWTLLTFAWSAITIALDRSFTADVTNN